MKEGWGGVKFYATSLRIGVRFNVLIQNLKFEVLRFSILKNFPDFGLFVFVSWWLGESTCRLGGSRHVRVAASRQGRQGGVDA